MRNFLMLLAAFVVLAVGGVLLSRAKTIDLGWQTSRMPCGVDVSLAEW